MNLLATQTFTGIVGGNTLTLTDAGFNSVDYVVIRATTSSGFNSGVLDSFSFDAPSAADTDPPVVQSIAPTGSPAANDASMQFRVTFDESAENVDHTDFTLEQVSGTATGSIVPMAPTSGTTVDITVNSITGTGSFRLNLNGSTNIADALGNTGPAAFNSDTVHTVDRDAPSGYTAALDQTSITSANDTAVSFTFAGAEPTAGYSYSITSSAGGTPVTGTGTISTATDQITGINVSGLADGTLTLSVTLTDTAGNAGSAATDTATKDAAAPTGYTATLDQDPVNAGNEAAVSFTFGSAEPTAGYSYSITSSAGGTPVTGTGTISTATDQITGINVSGLADGTLTLSVTLTDTNGNAGSAATDTATKDAAAPSGYTATLDQDPVNAGNEAAVSFTFAGAETNAGYSYSITSSNGGTPVTGTISTATDQITGIDVSGLADGTLTLSVTLTDTNGNAGSAATDTAAKESAPPEVNSITVSGTPAGNAVSVEFVVAFNESASEVSMDDFTLTRTGSATGTIASVSSSIGTSITVTVNAISGDGTIRLDLQASTNIEDANGNAGPVAFTAGDVHTVDRTPPTAFGVSWSPATLITSSTQSAAGFAFFGAEVGASYVVTATDGGAATRTASGSIGSTGQTGTIDVSGLADGTLTLSAVLTDPATNTTADNGSGTVSATKVSSVPGFSMAFAPSSVTEGTQASLTYTFDNTAIGVNATGGSLTNSLPAGLVVATPSNVVNGCTGGTTTAVAGTGTVSVTGLVLAANSSCTITLDVSANTAASNVNTSGDLTTNLGNSGSATVTLTVSQPSVTIADSSVTEGASGTQTMQFNVSLSEAAGKTITVDYATVSGTADAGSDFTQTSGTLTFNAGEDTKTIYVTITNDTVVEPDEAFTVELSNPVGMTLVDGEAIGTIVTDDEDTVEPVITSITRSSPVSELTNADSVIWAVEFSESVTNLTASSVDVMLNGHFANGVTETITGSGSSYQITASGGDLTSSNGTLTLRLAAGLIVDGFGNLYLNNGVIGPHEGYVLDNTAPTVSLTATINPGNANQGLVTATFSEDVTGLTSAGISVTDGTFVSLTPVSASVYTVIVEPDNGVSQVEILTGAASDAAGNGNVANDVTVTVDTQAPQLVSVTRQSPNAALTNEDTLAWTVVFDEVVQNVTTGEFALSASTASVTNVSGSGTTYIVTASGGDLASFNGVVSLTTTADGVTGITDTTGNVFGGETVSTSKQDYTLDNVAPTVALTGVINPSNGDQGVVTLTFSEDVSGLVTAGISVANGSVISLTPVSASVYTLVVEPDVGSATVTVSADAASDAAGNGNVVSAAFEMVTDVSAPELVSVSRQTPTDERTNADTLIWTVVFDEDVSGVEASDFALSASSGSVTGVSGSGSSYAVTASGGDLANFDGEISLVVNAGGIEDLTGNVFAGASPSTSSESYTLDNTAPTLVISGEINPADTRQGIATFTFSEAVTGFDANAVSVADGQLVSFSAVSSTVYTAVVAPDGGTALVGLVDGLVFDTVGNPAVVPETFSLVVDSEAPEVTIEVPGDEVEGPFTVTFRFTEAVTGFDLDDIALTNAQATDFTRVSDDEYTALITADTVGEIVISIAAGALTDLAGNDNEAASTSIQAIAGEIEVSFEVTDNVENVTEISGEVDITNPGTQPIPYEVLVDVPWIGVSPLAGTIPSLGTTQLTIGVQDEADDLEPGTYVGTVQVVVEQGAGTASTGGSRRASLDNGAVIVEIPITIVIEERFGTIEIVSTVPAATQTQDQFDLTSSDEDFNGLSLTPQAGRASTGSIEKLFGTYDVTQSIPAGWRIESISCAGDTDGGTVTDTDSGRLDIDLDPGEAIVCTIENVRDEDLIRLATQRAIRNFMIRRADRIVEAAPDLSERLSARDQSGAGTFSANVDGGRYNMAFKASLAGARNQAAARNQGAPGVPSQMRDESGLDVWFSAEMAGVTDNRADERAKSDFGVAQLGVDWAVNDDLLIGLLAQYDWMDEHADEVFEQAGAIAGAEVTGEGWMAGPYVVWRLADSLVFDGLAMYGTSDNQVNPLGYYEDDFETERYLLQANLTGEFTSGNWALRPQATLSHYEDEQQAYTDSLGILIPGQTVTLGRLAAGPEVVWKRDRLSGGFWQISSRVRAVWDYNPAELLTETGAFSAGQSSLTADGELGLGARFNNGAELEFQLRMSGIGDGDFEANSARINLRMPLNLMH